MCCLQQPPTRFARLTINLAYKVSKIDRVQMFQAVEIIEINIEILAHLPFSSHKMNDKV